MFDLEQVKTPIANKINTNNIPLWHKIITNVETFKNT